VNIELWVAEQRLSQGKPKKITDQATLDLIDKIITDLPPKDERADERLAS